jgi:hypothetical protein
MLDKIKRKLKVLQEFFIFLVKSREKLTLFLTQMIMGTVATLSNVGTIQFIIIFPIIFATLPTLIYFTFKEFKQKKKNESH